MVASGRRWHLPGWRRLWVGPSPFVCGENVRSAAGFARCRGQLDLLAVGLARVRCTRYGCGSAAAQPTGLVLCMTWARRCLVGKLRCCRSVRLACGAVVGWRRRRRVTPEDHPGDCTFLGWTFPWEVFYRNDVGGEGYGRVWSDYSTVSADASCGSYIGGLAVVV